MIERMLLLILVGFMSASAIADVELIEFTEKSEWEAAVGSFDTIDFTGSKHGEYIDDDYLESHGVTFSNAYYWQGFENDGWGFVNNRFVDPGVWVEFDEPKMWIAADHPGFIMFDLYYENIFVHQSNLLGASGTGSFSGLLLSEPFDRVYLHKDFLGDLVSADDLHFGGAIPAPGAGVLLAVVGLLAPRRRRWEQQ